MMDLITLSLLIDDAKCFELVRQHRWPEGVACPHCGSRHVVRNGRDESQRERQRYRNGISATTAGSASTIDRGRFWPAIISRCASGFCACLSWA